MSGELKILIEGLRDDIKLVAEGVGTINAKFDRHIENNREEHEEIKSELMHLRKDLHDHRNNTELNTQRKEEASRDLL